MDRYVTAALRAANFVRRSLGLKPMEGLRAGRAGAWECPIARTVRAGTELECRATPREIEVFDGRRTVAAVVPGANAALFMARFDSHRYRDLQEVG